MRTRSQPDNRAGAGGNKSLAAFLLLFAVFLANVLLGKARIAFGWPVPFLLGDLSEFLVLLAAAGFFVRLVLAREAAAEKRPPEDAARPDTALADEPTEGKNHERENT